MKRRLVNNKSHHNKIKRRNKKRLFLLLFYGKSKQAWLLMVISNTVKRYSIKHFSLYDYSISSTTNTVHTVSVIDVLFFLDTTVNAVDIRTEYLFKTKTSSFRCHPFITNPPYHTTLLVVITSHDSSMILWFLDRPHTRELVFCFATYVLPAGLR